MNIFLILFYFILTAFFLVYVGFILYYTIGWYKLKRYKPKKTELGSIKISVIVPARNENNNINNLLEDIGNQTISKKHYELIVVDDHSTDNTAETVKSYISQNPDLNIHLISLSEDDENIAFKKKAIGRAIEKSTGDLIITTDADCRLEKNWLLTILTFYLQEKPKMIVGPVSFHNETSFFEKMQTEEFLSLIAITGGAIRMNKPIMCNGANLAYEKEAFLKAGGFGSDRFSSGDDVFLMLKIKKLFGNQSIRFLKNYDALVFTEAKKSLKEFFYQRIRWASKNKGYDLNILAVSFTVYMVNLLLLVGLISSIFIPDLISFIIIVMLIKIFIDVPILMGIGNFVKKSGIFIYAVPLVILYPIYIVITGALGVLGNYRWKDRYVKN